MNPSQPDLDPAPQPMQDKGDTINLLGLFDVVLDNLWLIALVTALAIALGAAYAFLSTPIYEANSLIQVEESKPGNVSGLLGDAASLFEIRSPASAEMEILRSRLVVGQAVKNLQLDLNVTPKYLPLVGRWLARRATAPSDPGFLGMSGYVSGNESLKVASFDVPSALEGERFSVVLSAQGYELLSPDDAVLGKGAPGQPLDFAVDGRQGRLLVASAAGKPGATFYLVRSSPLSETETLQRSLNIKEQGRQFSRGRGRRRGDHDGFHAEQRTHAPGGADVPQARAHRAGANGSKAFPKERLEVFCAGRVLQLDNFRRLRGYAWPGFSKMNLWRQDKGQRECAAAFVRAVQAGGPAPIAFDELIEVSRVTIELAEMVRD